MKLKEYLEKEFEYFKTWLRQFTQKEINIQNVYHIYLDVLKNNGFDILLSLTKQEFSVLFECYHQKGLNLQKKPLELENAIHNLKKKALVKAVSSITTASLVYKVNLFDEVRELVSAYHWFLTESEFFQGLSRISYKQMPYCVKNIPLEVYYFFYSYGFVCPVSVLQQNYQEEVLNYMITEKMIIKTVIVLQTTQKYDNVVEEYQSILCYRLKLELLEESKSEIINTISYHGIVFNVFIKVIFFIMKDGISLNQDYRIHKKTIEYLLKLFDNEYVLYFILDFLMSYQYIDKNSDLNQKFGKYKLSSKIFQLLQSDIKTLYQQLIEHEKAFKEIHDIILAEYKDKSFSIGHLTLTWLKQQGSKTYQGFIERSTRRAVIKNLEILYYFGILVKQYDKDNHLFYCINPFYQNLLNGNNINYSEDKGSVKLMPNYELIVDIQYICIQDMYIISIFTEFKSMANISIFEITQQSIHRALYFGFSVQEFIAVLNKYSIDNLAENVLYNLDYWSKFFKKGFIQKRYVLKTTKLVLDQLINQQEISQYIVERISDECAVITDELAYKKILEKQSLYFLLDD